MHSIKLLFQSSACLRRHASTRLMTDNIRLKPDGFLPLCGAGMTVVSVIFLLLSVTAQAQVKIFIMAGQSNTEGHGIVPDENQIGTLEYHVANDPDGIHEHLVDNNGDWVVRDDVYYYYERGNGSGIVNGPLTVGGGVDDTRIGPELGIGHQLGEYFQEDVLLIKTAWGGAALGVQDGNSFHPPSSSGETGNRYTMMIDKVNELLGDMSGNFSWYNDEGFELTGFFWHQGWNDLVDAAKVAEYEVNLKNLIDDMRNDLNAENLPVVVGLSGMHGPYENIEGQSWEARVSGIWAAQQAMADYVKYPEHEGNVDVAETRDAYRPPEESPGNAGYHWNRNGESYFLFGTAMGDTMAALLGDIQVISGCTDPAYEEYDENATQHDSSACVTLDVTGTSKAVRTTIFKKPGIGWQITTTETGRKELKLVDVQGTRVAEKSGTGHRFIVNFPTGQGIYFLSVKTESGVGWYRVTRF